MFYRSRSRHCIFISITFYYSEVAQLKERLELCQQELEELRERYREVDAECETCAEYLRERDEQCIQLTNHNKALQVGSMLHNFIDRRVRTDPYYCRSHVRPSAAQIIQSVGWS